MHVVKHELSLEKTIIGIAIRTRPETAAQDIGALWGQFMKNSPLPALQALTPEIHCAYFDYESNHLGPYTTLLGYEVEQDHPVPQGMQKVTIPIGRYATFSVEGKTGTAIYEAWEHINGPFLSLHARKYVVDFERYLNIDREHLKAEISVGIA